MLKGVILSAGRGSRLLPVTAGIPKPLLPVANKPVLQRAIEQLRGVGVTEIGLVVREGAELIRAALGDGSAWGVHLTYILQAEPLGTGHAVQTALPFVGDSPFVLYFGDNMVGDSLHGLVHQFQAAPCHAAIGVKPVDNPRAYGVVEMEGERVTGIVEKPANPPTNLALTGLFVLDGVAAARAFNDLPVSPRGELELTDGLQRMIDAGCAMRVHAFQDWWVDIGSPERLLEANRRVLDGAGDQIAPDAVLENVTVEGPVAIGSGAVLRNAHVGPHCSIGSGAVVEQVTIRNSIILKGALVSQVSTLITDSVVGDGARVVGRGTCKLFVANSSVVEL